MNGLQTLQELSFGNRFRIPDYQRSYSWTRRQWQDLLDDLEALRADRNHFTGTIVLQAVRHAAAIKDQALREYHLVDVVDGQQRLTTLTLLLDAIRRSAREEGLEPLANGIGGDYVWILNRDGARIPRLCFTDDSDAFFNAEIVQEKPGASSPKTPAQSRLLEGSRFFKAYLNTMREAHGNSYMERLQDLQSKITNHLLFTTYRAAADEDVTMIFEALNDRGLGLTEMDLVKNYILYLAGQLVVGPDTRDALKLDVKTAWSHIFGNLMRAELESTRDEERLLRSHWLMAYESASQSRTAFSSRSVKDRFNLKRYHDRDDELRPLLVEYVSLLGRASAPYCDVIRPDWSGAFDRFSDRAEVQREAFRLQRCGATAPFLPLLMAQRVKSPDDSQGYAELTRACERYSFRTWKLRPGGRQVGRTHLQRLGLDLFRGDVTTAEAARRVLALSLSYFSERQFRAAFELEDENDWYYTWDGQKYLLFEYERHLHGKSSPEVTWDEINGAGHRSIEHILPQSPREGDWPEFSEDAIRRFTNDLGNLCLTDDNSSYSNKSFAQKRGYLGADFPCYAMGKTADEKRVAGYETWNMENLLGRRQQIVDWALTRWGIDESAVAGEVAGTDPYDEDEDDGTVLDELEPE